MDTALRAGRHLARKTGLPANRNRTQTIATGTGPYAPVDSRSRRAAQNGRSVKRAYTFLLGFYPRDYRAMFAREMRNAFSITVDQVRLQGRTKLFRFVAVELLGLAKGAVLEWIAKLTTDTSVRGRALPDLVMMRPPGVAREVHFAGPLLDDHPCSSD